MPANTSDRAPKVTLVTGATDGLGRATAILLAESGYCVFAGRRNAERLAAINKLAQERKLPLEAIPFDVTDDASAERAVAEIGRRAGPLDILVNNVGIAIGTAAEEISLANYREIFDMNFFGAIRMTQRGLPEMRRRGREAGRRCVRQGKGCRVGEERRPAVPPSRHSSRDTKGVLHKQGRKARRPFEIRTAGFSG